MEKTLEQFDEVELQLQVEEVVNDLENQSMETICPEDEYDIKWDLRLKLPNSYFLNFAFDDAIVGVNVHTGSIIYEWMYTGYLRYLRVPDGIFGDLGDRICGAMEMSRYIEGMTEEKLQGKVRPTILIQDEDYLKYWDDRNEFS